MPARRVTTPLHLGLEPLRQSLHQRTERAAGDPPAADGTRTATVSMKVSGQPAGFKGKATLSPDGKGAEFVVAGDVKVDVPFVGKKFEPIIAKAVEASLRYDVKAGVERLS